MRKIPTIFKRDENNGGKITREYFVDPASFIGAIATEKVDGTNVRVTIRNGNCVRLEKRCNPSKLQKAKGILHPWYVDASQSPEDKWIQAALLGTDLRELPDGEWSGEAVGPNIQGNPLNLGVHKIIFFSLGQCPIIENTPITYDELKEWLPKQKSGVGENCGVEGIVWHKPNGDMMKIKTKDFK